MWMFCITDKLSATEVETADRQSGIISSDFVTSVAASSFAENSSVPTNFMNNKTAVIVSDTITESFEGACVIMNLKYILKRKHNCDIELFSLFFQFFNIDKTGSTEKQFLDPTGK
jgi:hypothetical protein